ncbi:MAG: hypothetical protein MUE53_00480 [Chitinophagales bacterium]|jgi:hypothetical protein|nr:hypothetical protein [Chitinophagales bacterium]
MKITILILGLVLTNITYSQKSTIENINDATRNILDLFGKGKPSQSQGQTQTIIDNRTSKLATESTSNSSVLICKELCINNYNKLNAKVELKDKKSLKTTTIAIMAKDKSCQFDLPQGIYSLYIYLSDKLMKTTDMKIDEETELIEIPE